MFSFLRQFLFSRNMFITLWNYKQYYLRKVSFYVIQKNNIQVLILKSTLQKLKVKSTRRVYECIQDIVKGQFIQIRFRMSFCFIQNTNEHNMQIYFWIELMGYQSCLFVSKIILHPWRTAWVKKLYIKI